MNRRTLVVLGIGLAVACGDGERGTGTVVVSLSGERAAQEGYPVGEGEGAIAFADGYSLQFESVLVSIRDVSFGGADDAVADLDADPVVAELVDGSQLGYTFSDIEAARYRDVGFVIGPPDEQARSVGGVDDEDLDTMIERGYALWIRGSATDADGTYPFDLGFENTVHSSRCQNGVDGTDGLVVPDNATVEVEITIHLDHLWFDSFAYDGAPLLFEPWAAVAGDDGAITLDELAAQALADVHDRAGEPVLDEDGHPVVYDPGPLVVQANNLREYVVAAAATMGHFNGEGHCDYALP